MGSELQEHQGLGHGKSWLGTNPFPALPAVGFWCAQVLLGPFSPAGNVNQQFLISEQESKVIDSSFL